MTLIEPIQITQLITEILERLNIPYLVGGSLASSLHGIPRATQDVDLVAGLKPHQVMLFANALETAFYVDPEMIREAIQHHASFNVIHLATMFKVDIFILQDDPMSQAEMARRERYRISEDPRQEFFVASAEDTILRKLHWFQLGEEISERQWHDVLGVVHVQKDTLDVPYLCEGAQQLGVSDLLQRVFKKVGIT